MVFYEFSYKLVTPEFPIYSWPIIYSNNLINFIDKLR